MLKIIGAVVVYGFALFGLAKYFETTSNEPDHAAPASDASEA